MPTKTKKPSKVYSKKEIYNYLRLNRSWVQIIENANSGITISQEQLNKINDLIVSPENTIRQKNPNISNEATESFGWHLVKDRKILVDEIPILNSIERRNREIGTEDGADLVVNGRTKLEVKATTSESGFTSASLNNKHVFAAIFLNCFEYIKNGAEYIKISILKDAQALKKQLIETTGEEKLTLTEEVELAKQYGQCKETEIHIGSYLSDIQPTNIWFGNSVD